jgi:hypothetical protein
MLRYVPVFTGLRDRIARIGCPAPTSSASLVAFAEQQRRHVGQLALRNNPLRAGSGGRQSVSGVVATVFGSTGFLGRYVVSSIGEAGGRAICPHRCDDMDMQHLRPMGDLGNIVTLEGFSVRNDDQILDCISKSNVVINLIGQNTETWNFGFKEVRSDDVGSSVTRAAEGCKHTSQRFCRCMNSGHADWRSSAQRRRQ